MKNSSFAILPLNSIRRLSLNFYKGSNYIILLGQNMCALYLWYKYKNPLFSYSMLLICRRRTSLPETRRTRVNFSSWLRYIVWFWYLVACCEWVRFSHCEWSDIICYQAGQEKRRKKCYLFCFIVSFWGFFYLLSLLLAGFYQSIL